MVALPISKWCGKQFPVTQWVHYLRWGPYCQTCQWEFNMGKFNRGLHINFRGRPLFIWGEGGVVQIEKKNVRSISKNPQLAVL